MQQLLSTASARLDPCTTSVCPLETPRAGMPDPCEQLQPFTLDENLTLQAYASSSSRSSYAMALAKQLFTFEECLTSNCRGIGKKALLPSKLLAIKLASFEKYPIDSRRETLSSAITELRNSLDTHCRVFKKKVNISK